MIYNFFDKKSALLARSKILPTGAKSASGGTVKSEVMSNQEITKEVNTPIRRKFEKWKVYSSFVDNIFGNDLADLQSVIKLI